MVIFSFFFVIKTFVSETFASEHQCVSRIQLHVLSHKGDDSLY